VKSLERTKSRLAPVLSLAERAALTLAMVEDVLDACTGQDGWDVSVVSRDEAVLESAARRGARSVAEEGQSLNAAIRQVESLLGKRSELAVVLGDLPLLTRTALAAALDAEGAVVAAPSRSDGGTNVLIRRPRSVIAPRFGPASFAKHRWAARRARVSFAETNLPELSFDLDRPADLHDVLGSAAAGRTRTICLEMGLPERLRLRIGGA
jgi:2-phospho-L-lactate guanylyltransferase